MAGRALIPRRAAGGGRNRPAQAVLAAALLGAAAACAPVGPPPSTAARATQTAAAAPTQVMAGEPTPFTYTTPHPSPQASPLDGSYARLDSSWPQWWKCVRCADYRSAGGIWRLRFDQGVMRIEYPLIGWKSLASAVVEGDRLTLFNDPYCPEEVAEYRWTILEGKLELRALRDTCAFGLREENLESGGWHSCPQTPASDGPPACAAGPSPEPLVSPPGGLSVLVRAGDSRFFEAPPDLVAYATTQRDPPPVGIALTASPGSIPYGLNRILWWEGNWVEVSADLPVAAMGVQFLGEAQVGWARLLLDGQEVWRGDTAALGQELGRHGGYVEVSGFGPGPHTLRVESLDWEYRPVSVASFGFRLGP